MEIVSKYSRLQRLLIKIFFFPLQTCQISQKISFKCCSINFFLHCLIYLIVYNVSILLLFIYGMNGYQIVQIITEILEEVQKNNLTDLLCYLSIWLILPTVQLFSTIACHSIQSAPYEIVMAEDLKSPKQLRKFIFFLISVIISCLCGSTTNIVSPMLKANATLSEWIFFAIYISITTAFLPIFHLPTLFIITWLEKFSTICQEAKENDTKKISKKCIDYYKRIEASLGLYFLYIFSACQFFIFIFLFLIIAVQVSNVLETWEKAVSTVGYICTVSSFLKLVLCITSTADDALKSLKDLVPPLQQQQLRGTDWMVSFNFPSILV